MTKTPQIIAKAMATRTTAGLRFTYNYGQMNDDDILALGFLINPEDFTVYPRDKTRLAQLMTGAKRRGIPYTIG